MGKKKHQEIRAVSQRRKIRFHLPNYPKKKVIIFVIVISGTILLLSSFYIYFHKPQPAKIDSGEKTRFNLMLKQANEAEKRGNVFEVKNIVSKYLDNPPQTTEYKYEAQVRLAQACYSLNNFKCANDYGKQADVTNGDKENAGLYEMLGDINQQSKNDKEAIQYYKKALEILKSEKSLGNYGRQQAIDANIKYLENGRKQ